MVCCLFLTKSAFLNKIYQQHHLYCVDLCYNSQPHHVVVVVYKTYLPSAVHAYVCMLQSFFYVQPHTCQYDH